MQRNTIKTVNNITDAIANPATGDIIFFDIDETLVLTGFNKFSDAPRLTEPELASAIVNLQERGIQVMALTARSPETAAQTIEQLTTLGIHLPVIHAPHKQGKGRVLRAHLESFR